MILKRIADNGEWNGKNTFYISTKRWLVVILACLVVKMGHLVVIIVALVVKITTLVVIVKLWNQKSKEFQTEKAIGYSQ